MSARIEQRGEGFVMVCKLCGFEGKLVLVGLEPLPYLDAAVTLHNREVHGAQR
jgi:hypothetical protein